jgi:hypothetical protein
MKNLIKILSILSLFVLTINDSFSQGGLTGQTYDYEQRWLCDSASNTTFYRLDVHRPGQSAVTIGNYLPNGNTYTPTSTIKAGPCSLPAGFPDSSYQYIALEACDYATQTGGTPYFVLIRVATANANGNRVNTNLGTFHAQTGAAYTPTGTWMAGFCSGWGERVATNMQHITATNTSGSISTTNGKFSVEIMNIGTVKGTVTVNSTTIDLYPGTKWYCYSQEDPVSWELIGCPTVTYDCAANGNTTFLIVRKGD